MDDKIAGAQPTIVERDGQWYWHDETWQEHGPCSSHRSAQRRQGLYCRAVLDGTTPDPVSEADWAATRDAESEGAVHPCDNHAPWDCQCAGACGCHWRERVEWCWMERDGERCRGPFASRDEAIHDACAYDFDAVLVGKVKRYLGDELMPSADDLLEQVNESAFDNGFGWLDDLAFGFRETEEAAQADLTAWARKHIGTIYWTIEDEEVVRLRVGHR